MDKKITVYLYIWTHTYTTEYYSALQKKEILSFATTQMNLEHIRLRDISQAQKDRYYLNSLICGI